jgi:hypothetical protein
MADFADDRGMRKRTRWAEEFFRVVFGPEGDEYGDYRLAFVSDEATLWDVASAEEPAVISRVAEHYGVSLTREDFSLPFYKLLDRLEAERR